MTIEESVSLGSKAADCTVVEGGVAEEELKKEEPATSSPEAVEDSVVDASKEIVLDIAPAGKAEVCGYRSYLFHCVRIYSL